MNNTFYDPHTYFLAHHGIVGQKWGKRNGPPYPLNASTHNRVVKRGKKTGSFDTVLKAVALTSPIATHIAITSKAKNNARQQAKDSRGNSVDSKTGLTKKTHKYSEEEDCKSVNPGYKFMTGDCQNNCMSCSVTYDTRRRGFDVISKLSAKPMPVSGYDDIYPNHKEKWFSNTFFKRSNNGSYDSPYQKSSFMDNILKDSDSHGNSRGIINVFYGYGAGHAINYSVENGEFKIIDSQSGKVYNDKQSKTWFLNNASEIMYFRTDNISDNDINYNELKKYIE